VTTARWPDVSLTDLTGEAAEGSVGHDYQYLSHEEREGPRSGCRKDKHIVPINNEKPYDLLQHNGQGRPRRCRR
jgi:hypothetical protein